jgi:hypothetical protein
VAKFTVSTPLDMRWRGLDISGAAGATHRIPDALYDEFMGDFVSGKVSLPDLAWISVDEQTAVGGEHPNLAAHDTLGLATQVELDAHTAAADPHTAYALDTDLTAHEGAADPHTGYVREADANWVDLTDGGATTLHSHTGASGAPTDADYLVGTAHAGLSAEIVVGTTPGGELGGTWASPTVDATHSGSAHHAQLHAASHADGGSDEVVDATQSPSTQAFGDAASAGADTAKAAPVLHKHAMPANPVTAHEAAGDPHTGYRLESADHTHATTGLQGGTVAHSALTGQTANDHHNQAHTLTGADHTATGLTSGHLLQATGTASFAFAATTFSRGGTLIQADGLTAAVNIIVWRAPFACTVTAVKGYRVGGTGATVNARKNGTSNHLASAVSLSSADTWTDGGSVQNTAYAAGDKLEIMVVSVAGSPTQVAVQVDLTRP